MRKVRKIKIKYYSKEILKYLFLAGAVYIAASSPYFVLRLMRELKKPKREKHKFDKAFWYLKKKRLIELKKEGFDIKISLTKEGKKQAGKYQIDDIEIERPRKWDKKYRLVIFDVPALSRTLRDILRRKLKEWGFYPIQKSVWIHAFDCREEIDLLREFLGLNKRQIQVLEISKIEDKNLDNFLKKFFKL